MKASLTTGSAVTVYFSDSGFSDTGSAVWIHDRPRLEILMELKRAKYVNSSIKYVRILLLDTLELSDYTNNMLLVLSLDIVTLVDHCVDVFIGCKKLANDVDKDMFNSAIIDDGTIMRAGEGHSEWRIAKIDPSHPEYKKLLDNYRVILNESSSSMLKFEFQALRDHPEWGGYSVSEKSESIIFPALSEWMSS